MSYQLCRWYDPYPRLAFALKLLYLAPGTMQAHAARELQRFLGEHWDLPEGEEAPETTPEKPKGNRWYDEYLETANTVELIKNGPERLKSLAADKLLAILSADCA